MQVIIICNKVMTPVKISAWVLYFVITIYLTACSTFRLRTMLI